MRKKTRGKQKRAARKQVDWKALDIVHPDAAGIDVGGSEHWVAISPDRDAEPVRRFECFTADLREMASWLVEKGVRSVAMQSTGVFWMPVFEVLEQYGLQVYLVNARHTKNVPGRKSDIQECQWLLKLHAFGLLNNSFQPSDEIRIARSLWRHRGNLVAEASSAIQRMQKVLVEMNLQLSNVLSDLSGVSGMSIIGAILEGERDSHRLAAMVQPGCRPLPKIWSRAWKETGARNCCSCCGNRWNSTGSISRRLAIAIWNCANTCSRSDRKSIWKRSRSGPNRRARRVAVMLRNSICARSCIASPESTGLKSTGSTCLRRRP